MNDIRNDEHIFIAGMTGCGKTKLAEVYTAGMESVIKIDTKQEYSLNKKQGKEIWHGLIENKDFEVCKSLEAVFNSEAEKIIYEVPWNEQEFDFYNELFMWAYENGDMRVWVDELLTVCPSAVKIQPGLRALITAGRSSNATLLMCSQRPMGINPLFLGNSTHIFGFDLPQENDRKRLVEVTGCTDFLQRLDKYVFRYYKQGMLDGESQTGRLVL